MAQADFSESQSVDLHICRWKWCSDTFLSKNELIHHVLDHHVQNSVPCSRREYALSRKIEEGEGESLSFPGVRNSISKSHGNTMENHHPDLPISSSLPSPPASTPPNLSPPPPAPLLFPQYHFNDEYRTFAALSSPSPSPSAQPIPVSPTFSSMIEDAVAPKSQSSHLGGRVSQSSQGSASSSESCDAVEQQLTQNEKFESDDLDVSEEMDLVPQETRPMPTTPSSPTLVCQTQVPAAWRHLLMPYLSSVLLKAGIRHEHPERGLVVPNHQLQHSHLYRTMHLLRHRRQIFVLAQINLPRGRTVPIDLSGRTCLLSLPSLFLRCKRKPHIGARVLMND
ncbi:hypothetical protein DFS33DRAFT_587622 [Desarmillaria ectypa]|nr:hypothetical protein DFS33DRAFT_587622 [Desarmillaria ectypa]